MSGGPGLDVAGRVVGVVVAGSEDDSDLHGQGVLVPREALADALHAPARADAPLGSLLGVHRDGTVTASSGPAWRLGLDPGDRIVGLGGSAVVDVEDALVRRDGPLVAEVAGKGFVIIPGRDGVTPPVLEVDASGRARRADPGSGSPRRATGRDPAPDSE
jgi:S1-C subfamily serine protease